MEARLARLHRSSRKTPSLVSDTPLLEIRDLSKTFGSVRALDAVSFEIDEGITGLLGSNGAGKSTSLKLFLGLIDPSVDDALVDVNLCMNLARTPVRTED